MFRLRDRVNLLVEMGLVSVNDGVYTPSKEVEIYYTSTKYPHHVIITNIIHKKGGYYANVMNELIKLKSDNFAVKTAGVFLNLDMGLFGKFLLKNAELYGII